MTPRISPSGTRLTRFLGHLLRLVGLVVTLIVCLAVGLNVFLNVWLPVLVSKQPERIRLRHGGAWMITPGVVEVRNLEIRQQSPRDQWVLKVERATAEFDLRAFLDHTIHITTADAHGASFLWRARLDAPPRPGRPDEPEPPEQLAAFVEDWTAPIQGWTNPPDPSPESIYPTANPWRVVLEDIEIDALRELWVGDYHYVGEATVIGALTLEAHKWLEVTGAVLQLSGGTVTRGTERMLSDPRGQIAIDLEGSNPEAPDAAGLFSKLSATIGLDADVANLTFLDFYLKSAPWLHLSGGTGQLVIDVAVVEGSFEEGSRVNAKVRDIAARILSYSVVGDGEVDLAVGTAAGAPQTTIGVDFREFAITLDGDDRPHVKGQGFRISATTADVALDRPFTALEVVIDLPEAEIPDAGVYNVYLPNGIGLALLGGTGTVHGYLDVSTEQNLGHGELWLDGKDIRATLDQLVFRGDVSVHAVVPTGDLDTGEYDISGTSLSLRNIRILSGSSTRDGKDNSAGWWATLRLPAAKVAVGAPIFLDGRLDAKFRDTVPFVTIFSEKQHLPTWVRGLLAARPVSGRARIRMGDDVLRVTDFRLSAGKFEILLELRRRTDMVGKLYARFGKLSIGMGLAPDKNHLQVFKAREWYDAEPAPN